MSLPSIPDELLARFAFAGRPAAVAEHVVAVFEAGASRVEFGSPHGRTDVYGVELIGEKVLPAVREAS
jgi:5,10-methylenetetrahydromethanopterin reductase